MLRGGVVLLTNRIMGPRLAQWWAGPRREPGMSLLIDGYNLLHATGIFGSPLGPPTLQRSREALLDFLASALTAPQRKRTVVVFDAAAAPPGLPSEYVRQEIGVRFARNRGDADELLEDLIEAAADPRNLVVVSSDHRVQRAARRRGAQWADSGQWYAELVRLQRQSAAGEAPIADKPAAALSPAEVQKWLKEFGAG